MPSGRNKMVQSARNGYIRSNVPKMSVLSSASATNSHLTKNQSNPKTMNNQSMTSKVGSYLRSINVRVPKKLGQTSKYLIGLAVISMAILMTIPEYRWNIILFAYMPTMSGLWFNFEWLFEDLRRSYIDWEMNTFPHLFEKQSIIEMDASDFTWDKFVQISNNMREPVIVRGLYSDSQAVQTWGTQEWVEKHSNFTIKSVSKVRDPYKYDYELTDESFPDFVNAIQKGEFRYGYGLDEIYKTYPNLIDELELKRFQNSRTRYNTDGKSSEEPNFCSSITLFTSSEGRGLNWHNADHANFAVMVQGRKDFHLIAPKYSMFMGPDGNRDPYSTGFAARSPKELIEKLPEIVVDFNAGDALYTPPWYWHAIETYSDPNTKLAMLNTCRFGTIKQSIQNNAALELYRHMGFINWMHSEVPIALRYVPYLRVLQDGIREYFDTMPYYDDNECYSSKKKACESYFKRVGWIS